MTTNEQQAVREADTICPAPVSLTFDLLTLKVVSESRVTWATFVPILVFPGLSVLDLDPMYAKDRCQTSDRQTDVRRASSLNASALWGRRHNNQLSPLRDQTWVSCTEKISIRLELLKQSVNHNYN